MILARGRGNHRAIVSANRSLQHERMMMDIRMLYTNYDILMKIIESCPDCKEKLKKTKLVKREECSSGLFPNRML